MLGTPPWRRLLHVTYLLGELCPPARRDLLSLPLWSVLCQLTWNTYAYLVSCRDVTLVMATSDSNPGKKPPRALAPKVASSSTDASHDPLLTVDASFRVTHYLDDVAVAAETPHAHINIALSDLNMRVSTSRTTPLPPQLQVLSDPPPGCCAGCGQPARKRATQPPPNPPPSCGAAKPPTE